MLIHRSITNFLVSLLAFPGGYCFLIPMPQKFNNLYREKKGSTIQDCLTEWSAFIEDFSILFF